MPGGIPIGPGASPWPHVSEYAESLNGTGRHVGLELRPLGWCPVSAPVCPHEIASAQMVQAFDTVELNASFYRWPPPAAFASWRRRLPDGFELTVKAPSGLTDARRLYGPEQWIERMTAGLHELAGRPWPPPCAAAAEHAARRRATGLLPQARSGVGCGRCWSFGIHPGQTILCSRCSNATEPHTRVMSGAALPCILRATSDVVYIRLHGPDPGSLYAGSYSSEDLGWWAERIREMLMGRATRCMPTSTTTAAAMRFGTRWPCVRRCRSDLARNGSNRIRRMSCDGASDRLRFAGPALAQVDRERDHRADGQELGLPVLQRAVPELRRNDVGQPGLGGHAVLGVLLVGHRTPPTDCANQDSRKIVPITSRREFEYTLCRHPPTRAHRGELGSALAPTS